MKKSSNSGYVLEQCSLKNIRLWKQRYEAVQSYAWDHYSFFAHQRSLIMGALKNSLLQNCINFEFSQWQRIVDYQYCLKPLSARGSILNMPGGRFNIGDINETKFPKFSSLYLAEDRATAYKEKFGLTTDPSDGLTSEELTLTSSKSTAIVALQGKIFQTLSIEEKFLKDFYSLIENIKIPTELIKRAKRLNIEPLYHVKNIQELITSLLISNWRENPIAFDIPSNSQILGQICHAAGIEAILYPSHITNKKCLAVFPANFFNSSSYIKIQDGAPAEINCKQLDSNTFVELI